MAQDYFSTHSIDDEVRFVPMYRHQQKMGITAEAMDGKIIAVRFTKAKVFYDILDEYWAAVFDNVDSGNVISIVGADKIVYQEAQE